MQGNKRQPFLQLLEDFRNIFAKEMLSCSSLPVEVIGEVHVPGKVRLFESDHLPVLVEPHDACRLTNANAIWSSKPWMYARKVAACKLPDVRMVHPSAV